MAEYTETTFYWNNDLIFKLIDLYHERPLLWDTNIPANKDKKKKHEAWQQIAAAMGTHIEAVERKMKILYTQFRREFVKNDNDESKWFAYKKLLFLKHRVLKGLTESDSNPKDDDSSTFFQPIIAGTSGQIQFKKRRLSETESEETRTDEMYRYVSELYRERFNKDEFSVFGEHVAVKLRKLDSLYARCTAQYHINNILYKAEMGEYDYLEDSKPNLS